MSLSDLAPVYLDELNATAELMSRVDRKYPLHERTAEAILDSLPTGTRVLDIEGRTEFSYTSIYFDTTARDSYLMAARGRPHRFKVRVRNYQDSGEAFLEVKTRRGGNTIKERIPHDPSALFEIAPEQYSFVNDRLATGGIRGIQPQQLRPSLETSYLRATLLTADGRARLTLDRERSQPADPPAGDHRDQIRLSTQFCGSHPLALRLPPATDFKIRHRPRRPASRTTREPLAPRLEPALLMTRPPMDRT